MVGLLAVSAVLVSVAVEVVGLPTALDVPVLNESFEIGTLAFYVLVFLVVAGAANAVNLTDGLDGLAAGIAFVSEQRDLAIFGATLVGACIGFLWFNSFPAAVFMGDTGSYALGGAIAAMAVWSGFGPWVAAGIALGIGTAMVYPTLLAVVADVAEPRQRGAITGIYRFWRDLGFAIGAVLVGVLVDRFDTRVAILVVAGLTAGSGLTVAVRMRETRPTLRPAA